MLQRHQQGAVLGSQLYVLTLHHIIWRARALACSKRIFALEHIGVTSTTLTLNVQENRAAAIKERRVSPKALLPPARAERVKV
jgi:hypothetical protein